MADASGWEELPDNLKELIGKGAHIFRNLEDFKNRTLLVAAAQKAWEGKAEVEFYKPFADMTDKGLDKSLIILDKLTRACEAIRSTRRRKPE